MAVYEQGKGELSIRIPRGAGGRITHKVPVAAFDLDNVTDVKAQVRASDGSLLVEFSQANNNLELETTGSDNNIVLVLDEQDTSTWSPANYVWDIYVNGSTGVDARVPWGGDFVVLDTVTQP